MSDHHFGATFIKAVRKDRPCYWCGETSERGTSAIRTDQIWDGRFATDYFHPECHDQGWQQVDYHDLEFVEPYVQRRGKPYDREAA